MGNCQTLYAASLVIQHPNGKANKLYTPILAKQIMKMDPGHHVALLLATIVYSSPVAKQTSPIRITKIKLLKPNDSLLLGHVYRLVSHQEVMRGLMAKKQAKMKKQTSSELEILGKNESDNKVMSGEEEKPRRSSVSSSSKGWQPSLGSISEIETS